MKVFVISLPEQALRRKSAQEQLDAAGISFEFFDGIRGENAIRLCLFEGFDDAAFKVNTGRLVAIGELGCFASHRELWKRCIAMREPVMIMEDDFNLLPSFADALDCATDVISDVGFLRLQTANREKKYRIGKHKGFEISRFSKAPHGLMCYCVSPDVAEQLVESTRTIDAPVDEFAKRFWEHKQPLYALTPYSVAPSILSVETTITGRKCVRKSARLAWRRMWRKAHWYRHRCLFNISYRLFSAAKRRGESAQGQATRL